MSTPAPDTEVAIVTGGLRGLGRAMALGLLRTGRKVVAVGHIAEDMPALQRDAGNHAGALHCLALDLRQPAACDEVVAAAQQRFGGLDILVNNAGLTFTYTDPERFVEGPEEILGAHRRDRRRTPWTPTTWWPTSWRAASRRS